MNPAMRLPVVICALLLVCVARAALEPFSLPWNDATATVTSLQSWQPAAAGAEGWVSVTPDGHYQVNGRRLRLLGVNVTSADCFPPHDRAAAHAGRLAKFGFNAVRFHHMEAPWDKANVLVDYAAGHSRNLSADRLERLQYFVAQLADHGIYTNLNLLVSREFQTTDGLGAEIALLGWKDQHILGFFMDEALDLHREYATKLLTAPNPYRGGKTFASDPAVAVVEIQNENGLLQKWYENVLDTLPAPYLTALRQRWNAWLKTKYASTAELLSAWGAVDEPLGANRLLNGDFSSGAASWTLERHSTAAATATAGTEFTGGKPSLRIAVTTAGSASWNVQLTQGGLSLIAGQVYTVSFWAKAASATPISCSLTRTGPSDYSGVGGSLSTTLGTSWTEHRFTFQASTTELSVRLVFNGFGDRVATVTLADVRVQTGGQLGGLPDGTSLEGGNIPTVPHNAAAGAASAGQTRDWIAFVLAAEKNYWDAMAAHLRTTLGYQGVIWGTIISNSAPNTQRDLDAMDSHAYWQHPQFPAGQEWSPENWTVTNTSMVNAPASSTLAGIARQRVAGYPHNVTEYQHSQPNTYGSEGPLLAAAYGALQDWDSLWMFDYKTGTAEYVADHFNHGAHTGKMVNNLLAAALFRRGDAAIATRSYTLAMTPEQEIEIARTRGGAWSIADNSVLGMSGWMTLYSRISLSIGPNAIDLIYPVSPIISSIATSDTKELRWNVSVADKGVVTINTPRTKAVIGFTNGRSFDLDGVVIAPGATRQDWSTIGVTLLEGYSFTQAGAARALIVATGDQENTGQVWKDSTRTSVGSKWGTAPTLVEVIPAVVTLPLAANRVSVWALDSRGNRGTAAAVRSSNGHAQFDLGQSGTTVWYEVEVSAGPAAAPAITAAPAAQAVLPGFTATLTLGVDGSPQPAVQWSRNGAPLSGATSPTLELVDTQPAQAGLYRATLSNTAGTTLSEPVILGLSTSAKVTGAGTEIGPNITHPNTNVFDQVLLTGAAEAITADYAQKQITRTSFIDLDNDIVQVEFSGPGTLTLVLDEATGAAPPTHYNQPTVSYMKGHAGIVITGATEQTNVSVFTVGRATAFDPTGGYNILQSPDPMTNDPAKNGSSLFTGHGATVYDGIADIAFIAIASSNGKFGGVRTSNANYFASTGVTGLYAPGVAFQGPVYIGDITAFDTATPAIVTGSASNVRITGGDLLQDNHLPVEVSGLTQLIFTPGSDSHGRALPALVNKAVLQQNGRDLTAQIVVNP